MENNSYSFSNVTQEEATIFFELEQHFSPTLLFTTWLEKANAAVITATEKAVLHKRRERLLRHFNAWNEQELLLNFINYIIDIVDFYLSEYQVNSFAERTLQQQINKTVFQGRVDWMVATGKQQPRQPFFFIHEYKKSLESSGDPVGQLLTTMCVAQSLNSQTPKATLFNPNPITYQDLPIYGCYITGRFWYFVVLKDKDYYISNPYDAGDEEELCEIVKLLKAQKQLIIERVTQNN